MHLRKGVLRTVLLALALVALALPLSTQTAPAVHAQINPPVSTSGGGAVTETSQNGVAAQNLGGVLVAFNVLGYAHTVTFTCDATNGPCYNVTASVTNNTLGTSTPITSATCGGAPAVPTGSTVTCATLAAGATATVTINPGAPDVYSITFTGYVAATGGTVTANGCPATGTGTTGTNVGGTCYALPGAVTCPAATGATQVQGDIGIANANAFAAACTATPTGATCSATGTSTSGNTITCTARNATISAVACPGVYTGVITGTNTGTCAFAPSATSVTCPSGYTAQVTSPTAGTSAAPGAIGGTTCVAAPLSTVAGGTCPAGTGTGTNVSTTVGGNPVAFTPAGSTTAGAFCPFSVTAQKKYIEVTSLTPIGGPCGGNVVFSEGLKGFLGPSCTIGFAATGTVNIKTVADCPAELASISASSGSLAAPAEFGVDANGNPIAKYVCVGNQLAVAGVAVPAGLPITISLTNLGPTTGVTLGTAGGSFCLGQSVSTVAGTTVATGATTGNLTLCPSGFGPAAFSACISSTINTQAPVCSVSTPGQFTLPAAGRTVPYVNWAGEKRVLTKCFGGGGLMAGAAVEFTLKGNNPGLNATLLPITAPGSGGATTSATSDTIWTTTDARGCASAMLLADGEGVADVDAALFSTNPGVAGGTPIINEHAFEVFYLKFDHLDIENISKTGSTFSASSSITPDLTLLAGAPDWPGIGGNSTLVSSVTVPSLPGTGTAAGGTVSIPVCGTDYVRAMVHGYFEIPGDPSGRPAASVTIPGAPSGAVGSFTLPAGRWVLPEDWPVLATFAGFNTNGTPLSSGTVSSVYAWDINSGYAFNPTVEGAVLCTGPSTAPAANTAGPITSFNTGPCFGYDVNGTAYSTAPDKGCAGGATEGIGPFDITQACYNTFASDGKTVVTGSGLQFAPSGSNVLTTTACASGVAGPCFATAPTSPNSTYLPNGTLSQWDAPMPPAQITFVNTGSTGTLSEVNKSGLYSFTLATGNSSSGAKPTTFYYNPFYAEAIPASPAIPPVTNNGGYLWNSWNTSGGTTLGFTNSTGFVAGQSTVAGLATTTVVCPTGTTLASNANTRICVTTGTFSSTVVCQANFPGFSGYTLLGAPPAACSFTAPPAITATTPGGVTTTNLGSGCLTGSSTMVTVANAAGFTTGMTVEIYDRATGVTEASGASILSVNGNVITFSAPVTFSAGAAATGSCSPAYSEVVVAQQFGVPVANAATVAAGTEITLYTPTGGLASGSVVNLNAGVSGATPVTTITVGGTTYLLLGGAEAIAQELGHCYLSRGTGPFPGTTPAAEGTTCEPGTGANPLVPNNTLVTTGPTSGGTVPPSAKAPNPYPFWQWVPNAAPAGGASSGTVYSDNHGEAVVALTTPFSTLTQSISPVPAGGCPTGYVTTTNAGVAVGCILPLSALGTAAFGGFSNVATASAAAAGTCFNTTSSGTASVAPTATGTPGPVIGATGPGPGQICKNSLGAIEFGAGATLGSTTLQAIAEYPYTRGEHAQIASGVLTKVFTSAFMKNVTVSAGAPGPAGTTTYTVTVTAQDVCGNPISAEPIQVYAIGNAGAVVLAPMSTSGGSVLSSGGNSAVVTVGTGGTATLSLEVLNTAVGTQGLVVKVVFPFENIERFATVIAGTGQTSFFQQTYGPGWNQVGGPAGSNFGVAEALFDYNPSTGTYTDVTATSTNISSAPPACTGYWAYFANAVSVSLPVTTNASPATCTLAKGWNLVGNPFTTPAHLPAGVTAYHWNGTAYTVTDQIPVGGSVWVDNTAGTLTSVVLTP